MIEKLKRLIIDYPNGIPIKQIQIAYNLDNTAVNVIHQSLVKNSLFFGIGREIIGMNVGYYYKDNPYGKNKLCTSLGLFLLFPYIIDDTYLPKTCSNDDLNIILHELPDRVKQEIIRFNNYLNKDIFEITFIILSYFTYLYLCKISNDKFLAILDIVGGHQHFIKSLFRFLDNYTTLQPKVSGAIKSNKIKHIINEYWELLNGNN